MKQPMCIVEAHAEALPALSGMERLEDHAVVQVGTGNFKSRDDGRRIIREWQRAARSWPSSAVQRLGMQPMGHAQMAAHARAMGIAVTSGEDGDG